MIKKNILNVLMVFGLLIGSGFSFSIDLINTDPSPIVVGDYADVTVRFSNDKGDDEKENVRFGMEDSEFFYVLDAPNDRIDVAYQGEYFTRTFRVFFSEDLEQGNIDLPFFVESNGVKESSDVSVFVKDSLVKPDIRVGSVKSTPNELLPDTDDNKLKVILQNLGDKDAELVSAKLMFESEDISESYSYSLTDSAASINGGTQAEFEFTIDVGDNARGVIDANLEMTYRHEEAVGNSYKVVTDKVPVEIRISDAPKLEIVSVELLDEFKIDSIDNRVRLTVKNTGEAEAEDVRVRLSPDVSYPFVYDELTKYVTSKVPVGETASVEFKVEVLKDAQARDYGVRANLESVVSDSRYSNDGVLKITVQDKDASSGFPIGKTVIGVILFVSILFGINTFRNK